MVDPFSIVGAVGVTAGLVGFLASTIQKAVTTCDDLKECEWRLKGYQNSLVTCEIRQRRWRSKWEHQVGRRDEIGFEKLWGVHGWSQIKEILVCIQHENDSIRLLLFGTLAYPEKSSFSKVWAAFTRAGASNIFSETTPTLQSVLYQVGPPSSYPQPRTTTEAGPSLWKKVNFALGKSTKLNEAIGRLKQQLENLETCSDEFFSDVHSIENTSSLSVEQIEKAHRVHQRAERLWIEMLKLRQGLVRFETLWALLMPLPDDLRGYKFEDESLDLHFLYAADGFQRGLSSVRIVTRFDLDDDNNHRYDLTARVRVQQLQPSSNPEHEAVLRRTLKSRFRLLIDHPDVEQRLLKKAMELERARAALCIATWFTLAWRSQWVPEFCNCSIRQAQFQNGQTIPLFQSTNKHKVQRCFDPQLHDRPHLLLAVLLVEIGLAQPLHVQLEGERVSFWMQASEGDIEIATEGILLAQVRKATSSPLYQTAVKACIQRDRRIRTRHTFGPGDVERYATDVVQPLRDHYQVVLERRCRKTPGFSRAVYEKAAVVNDGQFDIEEVDGWFDHRLA